MSDFVSAMLEWNRNKEKYVKNNINAGEDKAPRKNIFITIPLIFEEEIKDFIKSKRKEADSTHVGTSEISKTKLMIEFEEKNPAPKKSDYE